MANDARGGGRGGRPPGRGAPAPARRAATGGENGFRPRRPRPEGRAVSPRPSTAEGGFAARPPREGGAEGAHPRRPRPEGEASVPARGRVVKVSSSPAAGR